jgi:hypothetical protein
MGPALAADGGWRSTSEGGQGPNPKESTITVLRVPRGAGVLLDAQLSVVLPGRPHVSCRPSVCQGRASITRLKGVSVARRTRLNPASFSSSASRASPAWAPSAVLGSSVIECATQITVDAP